LEWFTSPDAVALAISIVSANFSCWRSSATPKTAATYLIRLAKFPNVIDRKRVLVRHASAELAPLRKANAGAFHCRFGALNDFADWLAVRDLYKNVRISRH